MEMRIILFITLIFNIFFDNVPVFACTSNEPIVTTNKGKIKGVKVKGSEGDEFCSFRGIPYAKPPIGELRFSDPEPAEQWTGIHEATAYGNDCAQLHAFTGRISGHEDCLFLNIFTKSTDVKAKLPVMVWIHGGAFVCGSGNDDLFGPDYFMRKDVVLVTINYRLGIFGFLNLNDEVAAGNQGMKDMVMALQWVHDNIANFGGNPENVVIFGESAGASAVHLLALSPLAKGLFHKAIMQSAAATNPWVYQTNKAPERAFDICNKLGHTDKDPKSVVRFLRTVDAKKILKIRKELLSKEEKQEFDWGFVTSIDSKSNNPFMPLNLELATEQGIHVPLLIGYNSREGILFGKNFQGISDLNVNYFKFIHPNSINTMKKYGITVESLKSTYFDNDSLTQEIAAKLIDLLADLNFIEGMHNLMRIQIEKVLEPMYFYQFTYDKVMSPWKLLFGKKVSGACHADDLLYLFRLEMFVDKLKFHEKGSESYILMERMIEMWVNFATTGVPVPQRSELLTFDWHPVSNRTNFNYLNICENPRMENVSTVGLTKYNTQ